MRQKVNDRPVSRVPLPRRPPETEVEDLGRAVPSEAEVRGLEVAMDDALLIPRLKAFGDLLRDGNGFIDGDRAGIERQAQNPARTPRAGL
jgi:hypothetical protein